MAGDRRPRRHAAIAAAGALLAVTACTSGDEELRLVDVDDLPSPVSKTDSDTAGFPTVGGCTTLNDAQDRVSVSATGRDDYRWWSYVLENGDEVRASVIAPGYPFEDPQDALDEVSVALEECAASSAAGIRVEPLDDLPQDAVGYRSSTPPGDGQVLGSLVIAPTPEGRLVAVSAVRVGGGTPETDVVDLLQSVEKRADQVDLSEP